ncbi:hypothetical protein [Agromyces sp. NBRC 114283]|uniref:hypothetical protein n=1 Tax=Agromyces sp. NBRC 114283 TaxID=2994521 RepID=UPI0024A108B5|nr:hypothetical protein [Agromyces sp. NBRC 114283]GLU90082.1 hypothetical protein Agsp01_23370 [Agromyces sp. NBRC 114283]
MSRARVDVHALLEAFGPEAGALPDCYAEGSAASHWPLLVDALRQTGWVVQWNSDGSHVLAEQAASRLAAGDSIRVHPTSSVQVNFFDWGEVAFDFDLRELTDQSAADALCDVIALGGTALGRDVRVFEEGAADDEVLRYSVADSTFILRRPRSA